MKRMLPILILAVACVATVFGKTYTVATVPNVQIADRTRYTSNPDGILSAEAVAAIDLACDSLRRAGKAQIAVVAVDDIATGDVFTFAHRLFSHWGVGSKDANNGLGILLVKDKREIRFVTGDGLEGILPDALCKRIQQRYMVGPFSRGDFNRGMVDGVAAVADVLSGNDVFGDEEAWNDEDTMVIVAICVMILLGIAAFAMALFGVWYRSVKCPKCGKLKLVQTDTVMLASSRKYDFVEKIFTCRNCGHTEHRREKIYKGDDNDTIFMGGGFGGGHSGGGFGGGHFGGGGAGSKF